MKKSKDTTAPQKLAGQVQLARIGLARAENVQTSSQEQWRIAKRRRKEAKQAARRARKQFKLAKANVADATQALTKAEAKLLEAKPRVAGARKPVRGAAKKTLAAKAQAKPGTKGARPRPARHASSAASAPSRRPTRRQLVSQPPKPASPSPAVVEEKRQPIKVTMVAEVTPEVSALLPVSQNTTTQPQPPLSASSPTS